MALFYAESIKINPREDILDIGSGTGLLAIFAVTSGGQVFATDIDDYAVNAAARNARLNKVQIEFRKGSVFADFDQKFDVILTNLPNEIIHRRYLNCVGEQLARTFDGGAKENVYILELLEKAKNFMHEKSRLYLPVHTLTDYNETLRQTIKDYTAKLVAVGQLTTKDFVAENIDYYLKLNEAGVIRIFREKEQWYSNGYIFELSLPAKT